MSRRGRSATERVLRWTVPSLGAILTLMALGNALFLRASRLFATDGDVGRHIRVGRTILQNGAIPRVDLFSHTRAGDLFVPYEWLSETLTALADQLFGLPGVAILSAMLYVAAVLGLYRSSEELGAPRLIALPVAVLGLLLMSVHLLPRPHLFTTAFAAVFMVVLLRFSRTGRTWLLAPLPPLMLVWANSHGGFLIGFVVLAAFVAGALVRSPEFSLERRAVRPLVAVLVLCIGASLLNPAGVELWRHTTGYLGIDFLVARTQEYRSVDFHEGYGKIFFVALFAGPALWMTGRVRVSPLAGGLYLLFAAAALHSARNIPLFVVVVLPWLPAWGTEFLRGGGEASAGLVARLFELDSTDRQLRPGLASILVAGLIWFATGPSAGAYRFDPHVFPIEALAPSSGLDVAGRVFNQMAWGGYLLYERPDIPVFIDGQTDFYGEELSREYLTVLEARPGWREVLERHRIEWTLTYKEEPINQLLELDPGWGQIYTDSTAVSFRRLSDR